MDQEASSPASGGGNWLKFAIIAVVVAGGVGGFYFFGDYLNFESFRENRAALAAWRDQNLALAVLTYGAVYVAAVAFSVPGALWLTIAGGFMFGLALGTMVTVISATIGATIIYLAAKTALRDMLVRKAGPWLQRVEAEFHENEVSFMLLMRLVPAVPFFAINLAAAILGVRLTTYVWTTLLGIIPGSGVYTWVGAGVDAVIEQGGTPNLGIIFEPHVLGPIIGLCLLAILPIAVRKFRARGAGGGE